MSILKKVIYLIEPRQKAYGLCSKKPPSLLTPSESKYSCVLIGATLVMAFLDMLRVASIPPLITVLSNRTGADQQRVQYCIYDQPPDRRDHVSANKVLSGINLVGVERASLERTFGV